MAKIKEFKGVRPVVDLAVEVSEPPYDVVSLEEVKEAVKNNPNSFYRVSRAEVDLESGVDPYSDLVYQTGRKNLSQAIEKKVLEIEERQAFYLYTLVWRDKVQTGLVACVSIDDYLNGQVKKHELTREDKEKDRINHINILQANTGPVFLLYKEDGSKRDLFEKAMALQPEYDFIAPDGVRHVLRVIKDEQLINAFKKKFLDDDLYIADGHHRAASAVKVGCQKRDENPKHNGQEEYNYFLSVIFPHQELNILAYNRVVKDLNSYSKNEFLEKLAEKFELKKTVDKEPKEIHFFSFYLEGEWWQAKIKAKEDKNPVNNLDAKILQDEILEPLLGISNPRTDQRINFIGGIKGTAELERLVDSGEYKIAFSLYPTTKEQLIAVSDAGELMPPKSTWFEPKLRSGLVVHLLEEI